MMHLIQCQNFLNFNTIAGFSEIHLNMPCVFIFFSWKKREKITIEFSKWVVSAVEGERKDTHGGGKVWLPTYDHFLVTCWFILLEAFPGHRINVSSYKWSTQSMPCWTGLAFSFLVSVSCLMFPTFLCLGFIMDQELLNEDSLSTSTSASPYCVSSYPCPIHLVFVYVMYCYYFKNHSSL